MFLYSVRIFTALIWSILGFVLWIPLIFRVIAVLTGILLYSAISNSDNSQYEKMFGRALRFYPDGFVRIFGSAPDGQGEGHEDAWVYVIYDLVFAVGFYYFAIGSLVYIFV